MRARRRPGRESSRSAALPFRVANEVYPVLPRRDDCPSCNAQRDSEGRLPIGLCGDSCLMNRRS